MTTTQVAVAGAVRLAKSAAMRNAGVTACPYPTDGNATQRAAARAWVAEYLRRRPVENGTDFTSDAPPASGVDLLAEANGVTA